MIVVVGAWLAGCANHLPAQEREAPVQHQEETNVCMVYRAMMTAPMPPQDMERLRVACEASMPE
ncbi:hypothetical protein E9531_02655 [Lampropedia puyangensis]|uniref:Uncharacterized protein n=1 Tax=Lampropedia puyangensis TaxID=1330072 RepID=A0A4S8FF31_9BURK|nr:hypothetical protein E9531_02655 [Lampropedia puyangensis]